MEIQNWEGVILETLFSFCLISLLYSDWYFS